MYVCLYVRTCEPSCCIVWSVCCWLLVAISEYRQNCSAEYNSYFKNFMDCKSLQMTLQCFRHTWVLCINNSSSNVVECSAWCSQQLLRIRHSSLFLQQHCECHFIAAATPTQLVVCFLTRQNPLLQIQMRSTTPGHRYYFVFFCSFLLSSILAAMFSCFTLLVLWSGCY